MQAEASPRVLGQAAWGHLKGVKIQVETCHHLCWAEAAWRERRGQPLLVWGLWMFGSLAELNRLAWVWDPPVPCLCPLYQA